MASPAPVAPGDGPADGSPTDSGGAALSVQERDVLAVLVANATRVTGRRELARSVNLSDRNARRCDSILVGIRRVLGADAITTVRARGWMVAPHALERARALVASRTDA